jgi:hypothetical protein
MDVDVLRTAVAELLLLLFWVVMGCRLLVVYAAERLEGGGGAL